MTIPLPNLVLRAEETSGDLYASIDLIVDKLERQIRKHKTKVNRKFRDKGQKEIILLILMLTAAHHQKKMKEILILKL